MTIAAQLKQIHDALEAWAQSNGGQVWIASDPYQLASMLRESPGAVRAVVMFHSEGKRGDYEERGAVDRTFWLAISRGQGLKLDPGASLVEGVAGGKPLFDLVEEAREILRALSFDSDTTEVSINYTLTEPLSLEGFLMDSYRLEFSIGVQLPGVDVTANPSQPDPEIT